jgi:hypothetical protein
VYPLCTLEYLWTSLYETPYLYRSYLTRVLHENFTSICACICILVSLLGNGSISTFPQQLVHNRGRIYGTGLFLCHPCRIEEEFVGMCIPRSILGNGSLNVLQACFLCSSCRTKWNVILPGTLCYIFICTVIACCSCRIWGSHGRDYKECCLLGDRTPVCTSQETLYVSTTETSHLMLCKILSFHSGDYEECCLLGDINPVRTSQETHYFSVTEPSDFLLCNIWGFHSGDYEECRLLGYRNPVRNSQDTHYVSGTEPSRLMLCKIGGFHGGAYEQCRLLVYNALWILFETTFQRNTLYAICARHAPDKDQACS